MFMSDNGAEGAAYEAYPLVKGPLMSHIRKHYNNALDNIGAADSFVWYGPRWAQAATAPSRLYKLYTTEGGVRVPCIAKLPKWAKSTGDGNIKHEFATVMDIAPTLLELAGATHPAPNYRGREVEGIRGESMVSWLTVRFPRPGRLGPRSKLLNNCDRANPLPRTHQTTYKAGSCAAGPLFRRERGKPFSSRHRKVRTNGSCTSFAATPARCTT